MQGLNLTLQQPRPVKVAGLFVDMVTDSNNEMTRSDAVEWGNFSK